MWVVGVGYGKGQKDPLGENTRSEMLDMGFSGVKAVSTLQTYVIEGDVKEKDVERIGKELLVDSVIQNFSFSRLGKDGEHVESLVGERGLWVVEVFFRPGVMDPVGLSVERAIGVLGLGEARVRTGTTYMISGDLGEEELKSVCKRVLANGLIQTYRYHRL